MLPAWLQRSRLYDQDDESKKKPWTVWASALLWDRGPDSHLRLLIGMGALIGTWSSLVELKAAATILVGAVFSPAIWDVRVDHKDPEVRPPTWRFYSTAYTQLKNLIDKSLIARRALIVAAAAGGLDGPDFDDAALANLGDLLMASEFGLLQEDEEGVITDGWRLLRAKEAVMELAPRGSRWGAYAAKHLTVESVLLLMLAFVVTDEFLKTLVVVMRGPVSKKHLRAVWPV